MRPELRLRAWGYLALIWVLALGSMGLGVAVWGELPSIALGFLAVPPVLAARASRVAVTVTGDEVVVRNLFRTYVIPRGRVSHIGVSGYDGIWTRSGNSPFIATVSFSVGGRVVTAYGLVGRRRTMGRMVDRLRDALGLPQTHRGGPARHERS